MIERKFSDAIKLFGHDVFISDCKKYAVANPRVFGGVTESVNVLEYLEERGYDFLFSARGALYFRKKQEVPPQ